MLLGLPSPSEGSVFFHGQEFRRDDVPLRRRIGADAPRN